MSYQGRAFYNLLIFQKEHPHSSLEEWQVEDYRKLSPEDLLKRVKNLGLDLSKELFMQYVEDAETPEEVAASLTTESMGVEVSEKLYLLLFELWRKLARDKPALSVLCDDLDHLIAAYERQEQLNEQLVEWIRTYLEEFQDILDGMTFDSQIDDPLDHVSSYMAHDFETFLYEYISDCIDENNDLLASELIDGFTPYIEDDKWFDFLKTRLFYVTDCPEFMQSTLSLMERAEEDDDVVFIHEVMAFCIDAGLSKEFSHLYHKSLSLLRSKEDAFDLMDLLQLYASNFNRIPLTLSINAFMMEKKSPSVEELQQFLSTIGDMNHSS